MPNNAVYFLPAVQDSNLTIGSNWMLVCYGDGKFVAKAIGHISVSNDGKKWTIPKTSTIGAWGGMAYGNGKFVAITYSGAISTSVDGIDWTGPVQNTNLGEYGNWRGLAYGNGKFVAINKDGVISTSVDGTDWTQSGQLIYDFWTGLTYGNGKFVAIKSDGTISTSVDGTDWTEPVRAMFAGGLCGVAYGNGQFVVISYSGGTSTSIDGINWKPVVLDANLGINEWRGLTYGNGQFVAIGSTGYVSRTDNIKELLISRDTQYRDAALAMLPMGPAWNRATGSTMHQIMWAIGACMAVLEYDLSQIALETRAPFADALLPEWESDYGIETDTALSTEERRANLLQKTQKKQFPTMSALIQLALNVGYTIEIVQHLPFCCGDEKSQCGVLDREIGVTRSVLGIIVLSSTGLLSLNEFTNYMRSFLPAHVGLGVTVAD